MKDYRFIYKDKEKSIAGEIVDDRLVQYIDFSKNIEGNIYRGRITKYIQAMEAYVVDIGEDKDAILRDKNIHSTVKVGDEVIVELIKFNIADKMHEVTEKISLTDGFLILLPYVRGKKSEYEYFFKLRTRAKSLEESQIQIRYLALVDEFEQLKKEKYKLPSPKLLIQGKFERNYFLDYSGNKLSNFNYYLSDIIDEKFNPDYISNISLDYNRSLERKLDIGQAEIVIDRLEALTVIDVNSHSSNMDMDKDKMAFITNLSVIEEIVIQISLRRIKKMIIIDFIRMNNKNKVELIEKFKEKLDKYNIEYKIVGYSGLELLEMIVF